MNHAGNTCRESIQAEFMLGTDLARLLALNASIEAARLGTDGLRFAAAAEQSEAALARATAATEPVALLLHNTMQHCRTATRTA